LLSRRFQGISGLDADVVGLGCFADIAKPVIDGLRAKLDSLSKQ
jgi:hypothetical protein